MSIIYLFIIIIGCFVEEKPVARIVTCIFQFHLTCNVTVWVAFEALAAFREGGDGDHVGLGAVHVG